VLLSIFYVLLRYAALYFPVWDLSSL
jgi:hypothetical protein